jgi:mannosyltransferase OCH1-like enzyme
MGSALSFISRLVFKGMACLCLLLLFSFSLKSKENQTIPCVFHWIRIDSSSITKEEIESIRSWQKIHPQWKFKLWTNAPCSLRNVHVCKIDPLITDVNRLKETILEQEGGVYVDLTLIGCKSLNGLIESCKAFETADAQSMVGCSPGQYKAPRTILPHEFILPDQVFMTKFSSSYLKGVCFRHFSVLPKLIKDLKDIHAAKAIADMHAMALSAKVSAVKWFFPLLVLLCLLNAYLFVLCRPLLGVFFTLKKVSIFLVAASTFSLIVFSFKSQPRPASYQIDLQDFASLCNLERYPNPLTSSDEKHLALYGRLFTERFLSSGLAEREEIPHTIHFIWGGPDFPETSIANLVSWMRHHPGWRFKFWTDDSSRPLPVEGMERHLFDEILSVSSIRPYFEKADNWGEKSDLLRYEILLREGGLYVDHDIECFRSFALLHNRTAFYASIEPFHMSPIFDSHLTVSNCLIGARPDHPILSQALLSSLQRWDAASHLFPCNDRLSTLYRTLYRTFSPFDEAVQTCISDAERSIILPSSFAFFEHFPDSYSVTLQNTDYPLASHGWANLWFHQLEDIPSFSIQKFLIRDISFLSQLCLQSVYALLGLSLLFLVLLLFKHKRRACC